MRRIQRSVVGTVAVIGISLAIVAGVFLVRDRCRLRFAENLILREEPRDASHWALIRTSRGHLIRALNGRFKDWYLAADDLVNSRVYPARNPVIVITMGPPEPGPYVRNLILRERVGGDCYWRVTETSRGYQIQATRGRYGDWYLDFLDEYVPDTGSNPRTAWNLVLNERPVEGTHWELTRTDAGHLIQATAGRYSGWYVDYHPAARVLERNVCWGEEVRRDGPTPPLSK